MCKDPPVPEQQPPKTTGLVCPNCQKPVAVVEYKTGRWISFRCPACNHRWIAAEPGAKKASPSRFAATASELPR